MSEARTQSWNSCTCVQGRCTKCLQAVLGIHTPYQKVHGWHQRGGRPGKKHPIQTVSQKALSGRCSAEQAAHMYEADDERILT